MNIKLERPLAIFDLEATGLDVSKDKIVEIAIVKVLPSGEKLNFIAKVNPEMKIPQETIDIHGITDEQVKNEKTFAELLPEIEQFIDNCDLGGFNSNKFDIPLLAEEMLRAGSKVSLHDKKHIDVQNIFHKLEQRNLIAAYKFYCGKDLVNAHSALDDAMATWEVLDAQIAKYEELNADVEFLDDFSKYQGVNRLDFSGRLAINADGKSIYNFGKNKGKTIEEVFRNEPGYHGWFLNADFPLYTKQCLKEEIKKIKGSNPRRSKPENMEDKLEALKNKFK